MPSHDTPLNPMRFTPWTLDLTSNTASAVNPAAAGSAEGELPSGYFDLRHCIGAAIQVIPTGVTGSPVIELQWSLDGLTPTSLGTAYQITVTSATTSCGWPRIQIYAPFVRVATITAGSAGTANVFCVKRV